MLQSFYFLFHSSFCREQHNGNMTVIQIRFQMFTQFQSIHFGHHNIRNYQTYPGIGKNRKCFHSITCHQYMIQAGKLALEKRQHIFIVFYNQNRRQFLVSHFRTPHFRLFLR